MNKKIYPIRNDGKLKINKMENISDPGNMPNLKSKTIAERFYKEFKVGSSRYSNAMQIGRKITKVVNIEYTKWVTENHQIALQDGSLFNIVQIQLDVDEYGNKSTVLSLEEITNEQT